MAAVTDDLATLSITEGEDDGLQLEVEDVAAPISYEHCFVGRFLTSSIVNVPAMKTTLANVWKPVGGIAISDIGENRFLFRFFNNVDANRVEKGGLWYFNNHLLVMHRLLNNEDPLQVPLFLVSFWVLVHDVPPGFISEKVAKSIGSFIGGFVEYDSTAVTLGYKRIMRIRVLFDCRLPLKRKKKLILGGGKAHYVRFEYEKLYLFCFICGLIGHGESFCPVRVVKGEEDIVFGWDTSLQAPSRRATLATSPWLRDEPVNAAYFSGIGVSTGISGDKSNHDKNASQSGNFRIQSPYPVSGLQVGPSNQFMGGQVYGPSTTYVPIMDTHMSTVLEDQAIRLREQSVHASKLHHQDFLLPRI
ncbi:hypothetical protein HRI_003081900 [Hibiscus trionum]|uniref:DUF4283 domain-containing protein n=1 Tax=Hibiscus trionum TaxID=183268 RepID=A0A9W7IF44_HIBTR|nr:hypothetical protein HRI_003081900 [Hibiscus trionum]